MTQIAEQQRWVYMPNTSYQVQLSMASMPIMSRGYPDVAMTFPTFPRPQGSLAPPCSIHPPHKKAPLETLLRNFYNTLQASANIEKKLESNLLEVQQQCQRNSGALKELHTDFGTIAHELREAKLVISKSVHDVLSREDRLKRDEIATIIEATLESARDGRVEAQPQHCCANLRDIVQEVVETKLQEQRQQNILPGLQELTNVTPAEELLTAESRTKPRRKGRKQKTIGSVAGPFSN